MRQFLIEITADHVRDQRTLGNDWRRVLDCMGRLQSRDIGKRCYLVGDIVQCENDEQLAKRKGGAQ